VICRLCGFQKTAWANGVTCLDCHRARRRDQKRAERAREKHEPEIPIDVSDWADEPTIRDARSERLNSDYEPLKPGDDDEYGVGVGNDAKRDPKWAQEKRQEFSRAMGIYRDELIAGEVSEQSAVFIARVAEQERRYQNKRQARTVSIAAANEALMVRLFREAAAEHLKDKIEPAGYAARLNPPKPSSRSDVLFLSDLHLGANLWAAEGNQQFGAVEEARRLEHVIQEACEYKTRYRDDSELVLILGGDMIEGQLGHDIRAGAPLIEQKLVFWKLLGAVVGLAAKRFPRVRVICQPGNHGRDKLRHPGRATASKWDGHEWEMYWALSMMASSLKNVTWDIPMRPWSIVDLHGHNMLVTHGDTDIKIGSPSTKSEANFAQLAVANALKTYGATIDVAAFAHFHSAYAIPGEPYVIYNGMLVPANNHARTSGYITRPCGQWLWESVRGFPVGDLRFITVGPEQDRDVSLGKICVPFRLDMERAS
jgi:Calcineurin-like phosphoesterase